MAARLPHFSPRQVADALQVSESSIKRWCDRGVIDTVRTVGGHRRITLEALAGFLKETGRSLIQPDSLGHEGQRLASGQQSIPGSGKPDQQAFRNRLSRGDEAGCLEILKRRVDAGQRRSEAIDELMTDALHGLGEAWANNNVDPYQERRGCEICLRLIHQLRTEIPEAPLGAPVAIGGTMSNDPYRLPTAMVELTLREIGYRAVNLGTGLPPESFIRAASDYSPQLLWISVSCFDDESTFVQAERQIAEQLGDDVMLLLGGRALTEPVRGQLVYSAYCEDLRSLIDLTKVMRIHGG